MILFVGSDEDFDGGGIAWTHRDVSEANKAMVAVTKRSRIEYFLWLHFVHTKIMMNLLAMPV